MKTNRACYWKRSDMIQKLFNDALCTWSMCNMFTYTLNLCGIWFAGLLFVTRLMETVLNLIYRM